MINVVSVRVGSKYDPDYVLKLHDMIARNLSTRDDVRHWCLTDDPHALPDGVTPIPHNRDLPGWWQKVYLFSPDMPWNDGDRVLYMDLDVAVTGRLEDLVETKGIIKDWHWPCFNSSVMVWDHGEHPRVWEWFDPAVIGMPGHLPANLLPEGQINGGDQEWMTSVHKMAREDLTMKGRRWLPDPKERWNTFPSDWCVSYADAKLWPPNGSKVVVFHGEANKPHLCPPESWVHDVWKVGGFTSIPEMQGMNVTHELALANVTQNIKLDVEWFTGMPDHRGTLVLVCGGPSMKDHIQEIKDHRKRGAKIATVNNAMRYLLSLGIKPDHHIILDARPENIEFLQDAPEGIRYFLASQCDPSLFAALRHRDVILWHNGIGDGEEIFKLCEGIEKDCIVVPGGCTVGLRSLWLARGSGYTKVHVYGMDSSYSGGEHHAYKQALNDDDATIEVVLGDKRYVCAKWMARQANDFQRAYPQLTGVGMKLWVHGAGLIPDLWRSLRAQEREVVDSGGVLISSDYPV